MARTRSKRLNQSHQDERGNLVLARKPGQRVLLKLLTGENVWLEVLEVRHTGAVVLAIEAPLSVTIVREELIKDGSGTPGNRVSARAVDDEHGRGSGGEVVETRLEERGHD